MKNATTKHPERPKTRSELITVIIAIVSAVVAVVSMIVSVRGCQISESANRTAQNALDKSQQQFIQLNRPYVTITPKKGADGRYWNLAQQDKSWVINVRYEIKNVGNVVAKDVSLPNKVSIRLSANREEESPVTYKRTPAGFALGPGESVRIDMIMIVHCKTSDDAKRDLESLVSRKSNGVLISAPVDYTNELDKSQKYRTFVVTRFFSDRALLIKQEMLCLPEETEESKDHDIANQAER
jgi:type II secretory pathway pseudopilin PulG